MFYLSLPYFLSFLFCNLVFTSQYQLLSYNFACKILKPLTDENKKYLSKPTLWLMTVGAGLVVANNYYNLPLLGMISRELGQSEEATSRIPMVTQMGYACGLLLLIPLGDMFRRKRVILIDFIFIIISLLIFVTARSLTVMLISSFFIGFTSVVPQIFVPFAAELSHPEDKDQNVGIVMSGLLIGILGSRVVSGLVGEYLGWHEMYYIAAGVMFVLAILVAINIPDIIPTFKGSYGQLMKSMVHYARTTPVLRLAAVRGAMGLASFSVFWTVLTFHLERAPFFQGSDVAGLLGIFGIGGALAASRVGAISKRISKNKLIMIGSSLIVISWIIFGIWGASYAGLIVGIILLDMGLQSMHVTNQTIALAAHPEASNRMNTIYMVSYFIGGSLGTFIGGRVWAINGWSAAVIAGMIFGVIGLVIHILLADKPKYKQ